MLGINPVAVIDIGSNSVRLVIYDGLKHVPMPIFNEKILCGLGQGLEKTGKLNPEGVKSADAAIRRFVKLARVMKVEALHLFATAAVRDAKDGRKFVQDIEGKYKVEVKVFSGQEEAGYAGMGVISSISAAKGIVGDLGGGSLELIDVANKKLGDGCSLPIGPLRMMDISGGFPKYEKIIDGYLEKMSWNENMKGASFYLVGGAFRNLAKFHMGRKNYPLKVIHNYRVTVDEFMATINIVSKMSEQALSRVQGISRRRQNFLPYAAMLAGRVIKFAQPKYIVFSAAGVREGFLFAQLDDKRKKENTLLSGCKDMMAKMMRSPSYGYDLAKWMAPLFDEETVREKNLRLAACILSEISCFENTEYRAELAYRKILDSSLTGLTHRDRVFIAKSLYCRYSTTPDENILATMQSLLSEKSLQKAQVIGSAMRLGRSISASHEGVLKDTPIKKSGNKLVLTIGAKNSDLAGEIVERRICQLAEVMGLTPKVTVKSSQRQPAPQ